MLALSKLAALVLDPTFLLLAILVGSAWLSRARRRRAATFLVILATGLMGGLSFQPLTCLLIAPLETRFPAWSNKREDVSGILVLGGGLNGAAATARPGSGLSSASGRITETAFLARRYPTAKIVYSGGGETVSEAEAAKTLLVRLGIDPGRILVETRSRNTAQNAQFSSEIVAPRPGETWLLVTSAAHMPRAMAAFRAVGFSAEAYPVDFRPASSEISFDLPGGLETARFAIKEYVGLLAYRLTGRSRELFPRP